ncbi:LysR family transcriptional regulator [Nocardia sp. NPDC049707]|uniref:LysR family transcriptional regulator n=1 Tax=Nocardia sp. NPDC049707 TaxID=3154735 RepID=UPI00343E162A
MTLRQLEYFVGAVDAGTMSAAAENFVVSQSAISLAIAQLERSLGSQLLLRSKARGLALTPAGAHLLTEARRLLRSACELESSARRLGNEVSGQLMVGMFPTLTPLVMPRILREIADRHPAMRVDFQDGTTEHLQEWLLNGSCEVAVHFNLDTRPGIAVIPLFRARPYVVVSVDHPLADRSAVHLRDLAAFPGVLLDYRETTNWFDRLFLRAGVTPDVVHRARDLESIRALVARGIGWSILVRGPLSDFGGEADPLCYLEIVDDQSIGGVWLEVVASVPDATRLTARARAFIEFCIQIFANESVARPPEKAKLDCVPALYSA